MLIPTVSSHADYARTSSGQTISVSVQSWMGWIQRRLPRQQKERPTMTILTETVIDLLRMIGPTMQSRTLTLIPIHLAMTLVRPRQVCQYTLALVLAKLVWLEATMTLFQQA